MFSRAVPGHNDCDLAILLSPGTTPQLRRSRDGAKSNHTTVERNRGSVRHAHVCS